MNKEKFRLYQIQIELLYVLAFSQNYCYRIRMEGMGFEPIPCIHGFILKSIMNFVLVKN